MRSAPAKRRTSKRSGALLGEGAERDHAAPVRDAGVVEVEAPTHAAEPPAPRREPRARRALEAVEDEVHAHLGRPRPGPRRRRPGRSCRGTRSSGGPGGRRSSTPAAARRRAPRSSRPRAGRSGAPRRAPRRPRRASRGARASAAPPASRAASTAARASRSAGEAAERRARRRAPRAPPGPRSRRSGDRRAAPRRCGGARRARSNPSGVGQAPQIAVQRRGEVGLAQRPRGRRRAGRRRGPRAARRRSGSSPRRASSRAGGAACRRPRWIRISGSAKRSGSDELGDDGERVERVGRVGVPLAQGEGAERGGVVLVAALSAATRPRRAGRARRRGARRARRAAGPRRAAGRGSRTKTMGSPRTRPRNSGRAASNAGAPGSAGSASTAATRARQAASAGSGAAGGAEAPLGRRDAGVGRRGRRRRRGRGGGRRRAGGGAWYAQEDARRAILIPGRDPVQPSTTPGRTPRCRSSRAASQRSGQARSSSP